MSPDTEYMDIEDDDDAEEDFDEAPEDEDEAEEDFDEAPEDEDEAEEDFDEAPEDEDEAEEDFDDASEDEDETEEDFDEAPGDDEAASDHRLQLNKLEDEEEFEENRVFVIMHYTREGCEQNFPAIRDECSLLGLDAEIAKDMAGSGLVINEIYDATRKAEFIICDLTGERPNVYYELGQAHGLSATFSRVLLIAKESTTVHFDVASFRVHYYESSEDLRSIVRSQMNKMMKSTRS